jgi:molecular chaperone GrpE
MPDELDKNVISNDNTDASIEETEDIVIEEEEVDVTPQTIKKLRDRLRKCEAEKQEYLTGWQRSKADFVNARRKEAEEREVFVKVAGERVILELLPVLDSFDMAFARRAEWEATPPEWRAGIERIYSQLLSVLEAHGVSLIDPVGEMFNPAIHTAVASMPTDTKDDDNRVLEVAQKGFRLYDKLIRSPKVKIGTHE